MQVEQGKGARSNGLSHNWMKAFRPKVVICPHQEDYCDTCSKFKNETHYKQTTLNHLQQSAAASSEYLDNLKDELKQLKADHEEHQ